MRKQIATVGLAAALVAGGAGALALVVPAVSSAQSTPDTSTTRSADPTGDRGSHLADALQSLIDNGTINQEQADAVIAALEAARPDGGMGHGRGHGGPGGRGPGGRGAGLDSAATALGLTQEELKNALQDGQSIAELAAEKGVDVQTVIDAMVADAKAHLDEEVAEGDLTQAEADARLAEVTERITAMVNGEMPTPPAGRGRGPGGMHGPTGGGDDAEGSTESPGATTPSGLTPSSQASVRPA